jgi:hypothetical protein
MRIPLQVDNNKSFAKAISYGNQFYTMNPFIVGIFFLLAETNRFTLHPRKHIIMRSQTRYTFAVGSNQANPQHFVDKPPRLNVNPWQRKRETSNKTMHRRN